MLFQANLFLIKKEAGTSLVSQLSLVVGQDAVVEWALLR